MNIPQVNNGKRPDDYHSTTLLFWLPPDTPYGNFQLKLLKLIARIDELNRKLEDAWTFWGLARTTGMIPQGVYERHVFALENCVQLVRRATDELIALVHCLHVWETTGAYPLTIKIDSIGGLLHAKERDRLPVFEPHRTALETLNNVSNAFKHSFINSDHTLMGRDEPCVHALDLNRNKLAAGAQFYNVTCASLVEAFDRFHADALGWLRAFSARHQPKPS